MGKKDNSNSRLRQHIQFKSQEVVLEITELFYSIFPWDRVNDIIKTTPCKEGFTTWGSFKVVGDSLFAFSLQ